MGVEMMEMMGEELAARCGQRNAPTLSELARGQSCVTTCGGKGRWSAHSAPRRSELQVACGLPRAQATPAPARAL